MIAKLVGEAANNTSRLSEELLLQAKYMLSFFRQQDDQGRLVHIVNPVCAEDVLTDRWPESQQDQALFIRDLESLVQKVERLVAGCDLGKMQEMMESLFGESPAKEAVRAFNERTGNEIGGEGSRYDPQKGSLIIPASVAGYNGPVWRSGNA